MGQGGRYPFLLVPGGGGQLVTAMAF